MNKNNSFCHCNRTSKSASEGGHLALPPSRLGPVFEVFYFQSHLFLFSAAFCTLLFTSPPLARVLPSALEHLQLPCLARAIAHQAPYFLC